MCQNLGTETDENVIPKIAYGFGGGIGNTGSVCGAVVGAVMAIGLHGDRPTSMEQAMAQLRLSGDLRRRFEQEMGAIGCRELTGLDLTTKAGVQELVTSDTPQRVCQPAVRLATKLAIELLAEQQQEQP